MLMPGNIAEQVAKMDNVRVDMEKFRIIAGYRAVGCAKRAKLITYGDFRKYEAQLILSWYGVGEAKLARIQKNFYQYYAAEGVGEAVLDSPLFDGWMPGVEPIVRTTRPILGLGDYREAYGIATGRTGSDVLRQIDEADKMRPTVTDWDINVPFQMFPSTRVNAARILVKLAEPALGDGPEEFKNWGNLRNCSMERLLALDGIGKPQSVLALAELGWRHYLIYDALELALNSPLFVTANESLVKSLKIM